VSRSELQPGDLVFYYSPIHHVAIYIGKGLVVSAPQTGDVVKIVPVDGAGPYTMAVRL
jgi:cell wall-associated NlpC family hydrolase